MIKYVLFSTLVLCSCQLEEVLNRTSPFSIWINGENIDTLSKEDQQQSREFQDLEQRYSEVSDGVDSIFRDSMTVFDRMHSFKPPFFSRSIGRPRFYRSPVEDPHFHSFQSMFQPMMEMARNIFDSFGQHMGSDGDFGFNPSGGSSTLVLPLVY